MCFKFKINMKHLLYYLYWKQDIKWAGGRTSKVKIPLIFLKGKWTVMSSKPLKTDLLLQATRLYLLVNVFGFAEAICPHYFNLF